MITPVFTTEENKALEAFEFKSKSSMSEAGVVYDVWVNGLPFTARGPSMEVALVDVKQQVLQHVKKNTSS